MSAIPWQTAPLPPDELRRLAELHSYQILDTPPDIVFDRLTRMAAQRFATPIALVSLIDRDRQWFKSRHGIDVTETPRDLAFCAHAILGDEVLVVRDATSDPRFAGNPLVAGAPDIRFYAGAPLITRNGHKLGTMCVIDKVPHPGFSPDDARELADLAAIAIDEMELRTALQRIRHDLDALRQAQRAMENARDEAEHATYEKSQFIATISHELRTPMNGILGMAYLLGDTPLDKLQREYIETINHSAQNLLLLINDVLDMSKIEAGELIVEREHFDVKNDFAQTVKLLYPLAQKKGNELSYHIEAEVPDTLIGDQGRFAQIVTNLVGNAVKFTENGKVEALLRYNPADRSIFCEVKDTGIGIPEAKHGAIFEKFTQGDVSITRKYGGTGLGLAITKKLVNMLGGEIGFESKEGKGSRFWFTLPISPGNRSSHENTGTPVPAAPNGRLRVGEARVLIAEDHPVNQVFLSALLKKFGFTAIDVAENGLRVLDRIQAGGRYDAIFMDCKMPELDGYETTMLLRAQERKTEPPAHIPIIALTANALAGDRETCFEAGMDEYITKPVDPERLKEALRRWFLFATDAEMPLASSPRAEPATPPLTFDRLEMVADSDAEKTRMLALFFRMADEAAEILEKTRRGEEFAQWKNAAHGLKGAAANLGMGELEKLCRRCEEAGSSTYDQRGELTRAIRDEVARIGNYIADHKPSWVT
ncbi:MAG: ATP-binding protein [Alphaproteobacteria bacterium]|nr:ATP-binding protein [Alphaproteobacteria bacterium]